jgi:hypothetical protein
MPELNARTETGHVESTLVLSRRWRDYSSEISFVTRAVAAAAQRFSEVTVAVPGPRGIVPDGAFDLHLVGGTEHTWPRLQDIALTKSPVDFTRIVVDQLDEASQTILDGVDPTTTYTVSPPLSSVLDGLTHPIKFLPQQPEDRHALGLPVPVNPLAAKHRHNGLGFVGYILVLSNRLETPTDRSPPELAGWLSAAFHSDHIVVIEAGSASVWQGRVLRGIVPVESRTDFWRLLAHAEATVDLEPGPIVARECIESLRFGTPVVVPASSVAAAHTVSGAAMTYVDASSLISSIDRLKAAGDTTDTQERARRYGDRWFGNPEQFVSHLESELALTRSALKQERNGYQ